MRVRAKVALAGGALVTLAAVLWESRPEPVEPAWERDAAPPPPAMAERAPDVEPAAAHSEVTPVSGPSDPVPVAQRVVRMTGVVRAGDGAAIAGARVALLGAEGVSDAAGRYAIAGVRSDDGSQYAIVSAHGYRRHSGPLQVPWDAGSVTHDFVLEPAAVLTGVVVDQSGAPFAGARIFILSGGLGAGSGEAAVSTVHGGFRIEEAPVGDFAVSLLAPRSGHPELGSPPQTVNASHSPVRLVLERRVPGYAVLTVEVVDAHTGGPLEPGRATLAPVDWLGESRSFRLDPDEQRVGLVRWRGVRAGRYQLGITNPEGYRAEHVVTIDAGQGDVGLRVELGQPVAIDGRVVLDGVPREQWPDVLSLYLGPRWDEGRWAWPAGDPGSPGLEVRGGLVSLRMRPAATTRFRIEGVVPGREVVVRAYGVGVVGAVAVRGDVRGGPDVVLRVGPTGQLAVRFAAPCPVPELMLQLRPTEAARFVRSRMVAMKGRSARDVAMLPAGPHRWRIEWLPSGAEQPRALEGEVLIEAGRKNEVRVDLGR